MTTYDLNPGPFCGRKSEDAEAWLKAVKHWVVYKRLNDVSAMAAVALLLKEGALQWFGNLKEDVRGSIVDFTREFHKRYITPNEINKWKEIVEVFKSQQVNGQSVDEFVDQVQNKGIKAEANEEQILATIIGGLHPHIRQQVLQHEPKTTQDIRKWGSIAESNEENQTGPSSQLNAAIKEMKEQSVTLKKLQEQLQTINVWGISPVNVPSSHRNWREATLRDEEVNYTDYPSCSWDRDLGCNSIPPGSRENDNSQRERPSRDRYKYEVQGLPYDSAETRYPLTRADHVTFNHAAEDHSRQPFEFDDGSYEWRQQSSQFCFTPSQPHRDVPLHFQRGSRPQVYYNRDRHQNIEAPRDPTCGNCGQIHEWGQCPAFGSQCCMCLRFHHLGSVCRSSQQFRRGHDRGAWLSRNKPRSVVHNALSNSKNGVDNIDQVPAYDDKCPSNDNPTSLIRIKIATSGSCSVFSNVLLDTGSHFSVINSRYANSLGLRLQNLQQGDINFVMTANSEVVPVSSKVRMQLQVGSLTLHEWAYCLPNLSHNVILGLKFMRNNGVNLLNDRGVVKIQNVTIPFVSSKDYLSLAVVDRDTVIPPKSCKAIFIKTNAEKKRVPFQIRSLPQPPSGLTVESAPNQQSGRLCAISHNNTDYCLQLRRNTPIGYAVRSKPSQVNYATTSKNQVDKGNRETRGGTNMPAPHEAQIKQIVSSRLPVETSLPSNLKQASPEACSEELHHTRSVQLEGSPDSTFVKTGAVKTETANVSCTKDMDKVTTQDTLHEDRMCDLSSQPQRTFEDLGLKLENTALSEEQKHQFKAIVEKFSDVFALKNSELTGCVLGSLKLRPKNVEIKPFRARIYPQSTVDRLETERQIDNLFQCGFIERSTSNFCSPCFLVNKANSPGKKRLVFDLREPNKILEQDSYDLPTIPEIIEKIGCAKACYFSSIDLMSAYNQVHLDPDSRQYTAFTSTRGKFMWTRAPFGLVNSGPILCKLLAEALDFEPSLHPFVCIYVDDIIVFSDCLDLHMKLLERLFNAFRKANFKISAEKSVFFQPTVDFVGHNFSREGVRPKEEKLSALYTLPIPENKRQLRTALGGISYYRKFMGGYANKVRCLQELLKNDVPFVWEPKHTDAFLEVRSMLKNIPTLAYPDESETGGQFYLTCDASMSAVSYVLSQLQKQPDGRNQEVLIACGGRALRDSETRWPPIHTEALAVLLGVIAYKHYFVGRSVTVRTDSLTVRFIKDLQKSKHNRLFRWGLFLDTVPNLTFEHVPGKLNLVADMLSRRPYDKPPPPGKEEAKLLNEMMVCPMTPVFGLDDVLDLADDDQDDWLWFRNNFNNKQANNSQLNDVPDREVPYEQPYEEAESSVCYDDSPDYEVMSCCSDCCIGFGCTRVPVDDFLSDRNPRTHKIQQNEQPPEPNHVPTYESVMVAKPIFPKCFVITLNAEHSKLTTESGKEPDLKVVNAILATHAAKLVNQGSCASQGAGQSTSEYEPTSNHSMTGAEEHDCDAESFFRRCSLNNIEVQAADLTQTFLRIGLNANAIDFVPADSSKTLSNPETSSQGQVIHLVEPRNNLHDLQRNDPKLKALIDFIEYDILPQGNDRLCRKLVFERDMFYLNDDKLLCRGKMSYRRKPKGTDVLFENDDVLVLPDSVVDEVLHSYHDLSHSGICRLGETIARRYYFENFHKKVRDFVRKCSTCQKAKTHLPPRANLGETPLATRPGEIYSMDIVTGLSPTKNENQYILTVQDHFSRYIWLFPLRNMTSESICEKLLMVIAQGGVPKTIITDLAPNLVGSLMSQIYKLLGIEKKQTLSYSSKCLGQHERFHRTMSASIRCLLLDLKESNAEWDTVLPIVEFAFRTSVSAETHLSPMDVWLGRDIRMPVDMTINTPDSTSPTSSDAYVQEVRKRLELMYKIQAEQESTSRKKMIEKYNTTARPYTFLEGDLVYLNDPVLRDDKTRKLAPQWSGPFEVIEVSTPHSLKLRDLLTQKDVPNAIHIDRLKKCWSSRESFLGQPEKPNLSVPESILDQKGQKYLVRYSTYENDGLNSTKSDKWVKITDVPSLLLEEWRKSHRKDGEPRSRPQKHQLHQRHQRDPSPSNEDVNYDSTGNIEDSTSNRKPKPNVQISKQSVQKSNIKRIVPKKALSDTVNNDLPFATRRSQRNVPRVDYREFDDHGFQ